MGAQHHRHDHGRMKPNTSADVAVVGGGAAGVCMAPELAGRGASMVLLERGAELAWDCSADNAGNVGSSNGAPRAATDDVEARPGDPELPIWLHESRDRARMRGLQLAPFTGRLVASVVAGEQTEQSPSLRADRFRIRPAR